MTVTVAPAGYAQIDSCDIVGNWSGSPVIYTDISKENNACLGETVKLSGNNDIILTWSGDLSGTKHLRFWFISTHGGKLNLKASGGLQLGLSDGTNTGYWYVSGSDEYPGGWDQAIVNLANAVDSGTKPTMSSITSLIIRINLTGAAKNTDNFWWDNVIYCDGLTAYGDDAGGSFDFENIFIADDAQTGGWGIFRKYNDVYYLTGSLTVGDASSTNSTDFQATDQIVVFVDKSAYVNTSLYAINVVGNATGATQSFKLGDKVGGAGVSGCFIKCNITSLAFELTATDTDVDVFGIYGTTFDTYGTMDFQPNGANLEILDSNFNNGQGQVQPNTMTFTGNLVSGGVSTDGSVLYESTSHNISYTNYINNSRATEFTVANTYTMTGDLFTGGTYDIHFSASTGDLIINCAGSPKANPNPSQVENDSSGTVTINNVVNLTITVRDADDESLISGALVYMYASSGSGDYPYQDSVGITRSGATATVTHTTHGLQTDEYVLIAGCNEEEYHGVYAITVTDVNTYTYTLTGTPDTPATGAPVSTFVIVFESTVSGVASDTMRYLTLDQPFAGKVRKASASPFYKTTGFSGSIENTDFATTVYMVDDE